jgi:hypothetical protein
MDLFSSRSSNFEPIEPLPINPITGDPELTEPLPDPNAPEYKKMRKDFAKDVGKGMITSPVTGTADIVELGAMLPDPKVGTGVSPTYMVIEETFDQLKNIGITRDNAEKLIKDVTGIELEGTAGEFTGELIGLPVAAATKAGTSILSAAAKYGDKAGEFLSDIADEAKGLFRTASGGDDFDGMAPATVADTPPVAAQTDQAFDVTPTMPDTSVSPTMIGTNTGAGRQAVDEYEAMKAADPDMDDAELFAQTGVYMGPDGKPRFELDTTDAKLATVANDADELVPIVETLSEGSKVRLDEILDFRQLMDAYDKKFYDSTKLDFVSPVPISDMAVEIVDPKTMNGASGSYSYVNMKIKLSSDLLDNPDQLLSVLMHEVQHAVQHKEGFTGGSNKRAFIEASAKALDPNGRMGTIDGMTTLLAYRDMATNAVKDLTQFEQTQLQNHLKGTVGSPSLTPNVKLETEDIETFYDMQNVIYEFLKKAGHNNDTVTSSDLNGLYSSQGLRNFFDQLLEEGGTATTPEMVEEVAGYKSFLDKLDNAGNSDQLLRKIMRPAMRSKMNLGFLRDVEETANANYYRKYGEVESRLVQERDARRKELLDMGFSRGDIFSIMRDEFPPLNYSISKEIMEKGGFDTQDLDVIVSHIPDRRGSELVRIPEDFTLLEGAEGNKGINFSAAESDDFSPYSGQMGRGFVDAAIEGRRQASANAVKMFAEDGALDAFKVGDRIPGKNTSFKVTGYSAQGFSEEAMEKQIDQYQRLRKDQIEAGTVPEQPTYMLGDDGKYYRLVINVEGDDGTVTQLSHDILTHQNKKFDKFLGKLNMAEGGVVPMDRQMDMFADGGLEQDGGTNDPVSGNEVPPGSTQEEVRDDIPAQLSEGEFVFPADVVRFIGLEKLMRMRQEAKMGLKMMEEMGQMGNSDEATMPDDLPFDINDLDMDDEPEYNVGGFVPAAPQQQQQFGISGYTPAAAPTTGFTQAASQQFVQPPTPVAQAPTPIMQQYEAPQFSEFVGGGFGEYDELREYRNEAGNVMMIPFKDGNPISPIPEGYTFYDPEETATEKVTTTPTTPQTTQVREDDPSDDKDPGFSTTDVTGIGYDKSKLDPLLKETIDDFGFGFGALADTFSKVGITSAVASMMDKDPRVSANVLTSSTFGGVVDAFRGGDVNFTDRPGRKTGTYDDNTSLHEMSLSKQRNIANVARTVVTSMRDIFVDDNGRAKPEAQVKSDLIKEAKKNGVAVTIPGTNISYRTETIARELSKKKAEDIIAQKEQERQARADAAAEASRRAEQEFYQLSVDPDTSGDTYMGGPVSLAQAREEDLDVTGTAGAFTGEPIGMEDEYDFNTGGLASKKKTKPKKMKRGGLASKK